MTFSEKPRTTQRGFVACLAVSICLLLSVIGCGVARFDSSATDAAATALLTTSVDDAERTDLETASPPGAHKTFDVIAQHHRTLPHRMRSLTPWRWWRLAPAWLVVRHQLDIGDPSGIDVFPTGRKLLTQFCISLR